MNAKAHSHCAFARQIAVDIQRIQFVVLPGKIQQAERDLRPAARKSVASKGVELPEIITGRARKAILCIPKRLSFRKETTRAVVDAKKIQIVQDSFHTLPRH